MGGQRNVPQGQQQTKSTSQQESAPWAGLQPYLSNIFGLGKQEFQRGAPQIAGYGEDFQTGRDLIGQTARGDYLYGGDAFNRALDAAKSRIIPSVESRFARGGRLSSGLARAAEASGIGDAFARQYGQERQLQQQAQQFLPGLAEMQRGVEQQRLDAPHTALSRYADLLGKFPFTQSTGTSTGYTDPMYRGSRTSGILGGALAGGKLGSAFGPWGAALGAIGGGIGGRYL